MSDLGLSNRSAFMTEKSHPDDKEAERRFNETLGRLANMPPQPHKPKKRANPGPHPMAAN